MQAARHTQVVVTHASRLVADIEDGGLVEDELLRIPLSKHLAQTQAEIPEIFETPAWRWASR